MANLMMQNLYIKLWKNWHLVANLSTFYVQLFASRFMLIQVNLGQRAFVRVKTAHKQVNEIDPWQLLCAQIP